MEENQVRENQLNVPTNEVIILPKKRYWKSYFKEFFMLFLAVSLGFFVENQWESYVERNLEISECCIYCQTYHH